MTGALLLIASAALLVAGAELFVDNAVGAARRLGVTLLAVGLLLAGAEPEELLTASLASWRHHPGLAAGDAVGANVTLLTATLGLAALVRPVPISRRVRLYAGLAAATGLLALAVLADGRVSRVEGGLLVAAYAVLVAGIWWREREPPRIGELAELTDEEDDEAEADDGQDGEGADQDGRDRTPAPARSLLLALFGLALMLGGGDLAVEGAVRVLAAVSATESAIGLTALALATTAELFALVWAAARKGVDDVAVAGLVGSAAYNATMTLGGAALVRPLHTSGLVPAALAAAALPLAILGLARRGSLGRPAGALLTAGYAAYLWLVLR